MTSSRIEQPLQLIDTSFPEPAIGRQVKRYGMVLTHVAGRDGDHMWTGIDMHGNPGACSWDELWWLGGDAEHMLLCTDLGWKNLIGSGAIRHHYFILGDPSKDGAQVVSLCGHLRGGSRQHASYEPEIAGVPGLRRDECGTCRRTLNARGVK